MVFKCKRLSIIFCVLCLFLSSVCCQEPTSCIEYRSVDERSLDATILTLNRQLLVPANLMARSSSGGTNWNNTDQLLDEAEAIILTLQEDRDAWKERASSIEAENRRLKVSLGRQKSIRNVWIGISVSAVTISVVTLLICCNK